MIQIRTLRPDTEMSCNSCHKTYPPIYEIRVGLNERQTITVLLCPECLRKLHRQTGGKLK